MNYIYLNNLILYLKVDKKAEKIANKLAMKKGEIHLLSINDLLPFS